MNDTTHSSGFQITGRHAFMAMAVFFGIIFLSNAVMIYLAVSTFPGNVSDTAYQDGRDYNQLLEAASQQQALGWQTEASLEKLPAQNAERRALVRLHYTNREGEPLTGLQVSGALMRPSQQGTDVTLDLVPQGSGVYAVQISLPYDGLWDLKVTAKNNDGLTHKFEQRLFVPENSEK